MEKLYICDSLDQLDEIAVDILDRYPEPVLFALYGEMGSGKTTLIKSLCKALGTLDKVTSPTFALINEYQTERAGPVYHFDVYRIKKIEEVMDIGYETYFFSGHYVFVEWPELITELLPEEYVYIKIREREDRKREILVKS
ncbi:MAG: tRNA (adenosine(37)-N6)-threonylcarbamoyltransferase complex ATPase subunit type 1 TsaE [Bacteroidetes bacterium]|nr:MAG: tRNA (adenosine(37)-N6)-threonylcarbamoyltransferase complex ATPase subunit type 1 TsaE [Bacteroidota bacterium]